MEKGIVPTKKFAGTAWLFAVRIAQILEVICMPHGPHRPMASLAIAAEVCLPWIIAF